MVQPCQGIVFRKVWQHSQVILISDLDGFEKFLLNVIFAFQVVYAHSKHQQHEKQLQEGQHHYQLVVGESHTPRYGSCWKDALKQLEEGCKRLTDDVQRWLALQFTNCFLEKAGQVTYKCDGVHVSDHDGMRVCLSQMNNNGFTAFTNFFTHTQSICYFLQTQVWQEETDNTVAKLKDNSMKVVETLEATNDLQDAILDAQRKSLFQQERLLESSSQLGIALDMSKDNVKNMLEEFRLSTSEHRNMIFEVFDRLSKLQNFVMGEVSGFYSLIFYPTALLTVYLLTSTSRTAAARFWLFVLFGCSLAMERCIVHWTVVDVNGYLPADEASKEMFWRIWLVRKTAMMFCVLLLAYFAYQFQDYNLINNTLLLQIQRTNMELKGKIESIGGVRNSNYPMSSDEIDFEKKKMPFDESSDSDFSYDSEASDGSYMPSDDDDAFITAKSGLLSAVASPDILQVSFDEIKKIKREPPASNSNRSSRFNTPAIQSVYNLRSRSSLRPLNTSAVSNEIKSETPEIFGRKVKELERVARNNARQMIQSLKTVKKNTPSYFSSDDE